MKSKSTLFDKPVYKVNPYIKSHANAPFVKRKVAEAKAILSKLEKPLQKRKSEVEG